MIKQLSFKNEIKALHFLSTECESALKYYNETLEENLKLYAKTDLTRNQSNALTIVIEEQTFLK